MNEIELKILITQEEIKSNVMVNAQYIRKQLGYSTAGMGQRLGISRQTYEAMEAGKSMVAANLMNLAAMCKLSLENLLLNDLSKQGK